MLSHLERCGSTVKIIFFDFSSALDTVQSVLLRDKLEGTKVDQQLAVWILEYLTN